MPVLSLHGSPGRSLRGGWEETIASALEQGRKKMQKGRRFDRAEAELEWISGACLVESTWNPSFVCGVSVLEIHNLSLGTLVCGGLA